MRKNRAYGKELRDLVLMVILEHGKNGISIKDISNNLRKDRNIISVICKDLEKSSFVHIKKRCNQKMISPTSKAVDNQSVSSSKFLGNQIKNRVLSYRSFEVLEMDREQIIKFYKRQADYLEGLNYQMIQTIPSSGARMDEKTIDIERFGSTAIRLQNFILKIGFSIVYLILKDVSPKNIDRIAKSLDLSNVIMIDKLLEEWLKNVVSSMDLLNQFKQNILQSEYHKSLRNRSNKPIHELDMDIISSSLLVMQGLYPEMVNNLEKIFNDLTNSMVQYNEDLNHLACNHEYNITSLGKKIRKQEPEDQYEDVIKEFQKNNTKKGIQKFQCIKCNKVIKINLDHKISDNNLVNELNCLSKMEEKRKRDNNIKKQKNVSKNYKLRKQTIYDVLGSSPYLPCKKNKHIWNGPSVLHKCIERNRDFYEIYDCQLCNTSIKRFIINKQTIKLARIKIEEEIGSDIFTFQMADKILKTLYEDKDNCYRIDDFRYLEYVDSNRRKTYLEEEFKKNINNLFNIFLEYNMIIRCRSEESFSFNKK